jgi:hypothetical protein
MILYTITPRFRKRANDVNNVLTYVLSITSRMERSKVDRPSSRHLVTRGRLRMTRGTKLSTLI